MCRTRLWRKADPRRGWLGHWASSDGKILTVTYSLSKRRTGSSINGVITRKLCENQADPLDISISPIFPAVFAPPNMDSLDSAAFQWKVDIPRYEWLLCPAWSPDLFAVSFSPKSAGVAVK